MSLFDSLLKGNRKVKTKLPGEILFGQYLYLVVKVVLLYWIFGWL